MSPAAARLLTACVLLAAAASGADPAVWRRLGPGGGGAMFHPTWSPHSPDVAAVASDMTGSFLTTDGGRSWRTFNLRGPIRWFAFHPAKKDVLFAGGIGLWRSDDQARTWKLVYPDPKLVSGVSSPDDHAGETLMSGAESAPVPLAVTFEQAQPYRMFGAFMDNNRYWAAESSDEGKNWKEAGGLSAFPLEIGVFRENGICVVTHAGILTRQRGKWSAGRAAHPGGRIREAVIRVPAEAPPAVYAISEDGLAAVSADGGDSWLPLRAASPAPYAQALAIGRSQPPHLFLSYSRLQSLAIPNLAHRSESWGVAVSVDEGRSWQWPWRESGKPGDNIADAWMSATFGAGWAGNPLGLGASPADPARVLGTDYGRALISRDAGRSWSAAYSRKGPGGGWVSTGLDVTTAYGIHFDPFDAKRQFISYTDIGLFRSEDGGESWLSSSSGVPRKWVNTAYWMVFDPAVRGRAWAVMSGTHDLPRPKMWRGREVSSFTGGICRSDDGGRTWKPVEGLPQMAATHILLDPASSEKARVLYVTAFGRGVYRSADGGQSWELRNQGIEGAEPFAWRLERDAEGWLYLVVARRSEDRKGAFGNWQDGALYRSRDEARTWERVALPAGVNGPSGIAVDPKDPRKLLLAAWARQEGRESLSGGIYRSLDRGRTWKRVLDGDQHVYDVTADPRKPGLYYASGFENSAWRSADGGSRWQRIAGYDFKWGHRVIPDPQSPETIYVTTFGGSVWKGPAAGGAAESRVVTEFPGRAVGLL